MNLTSRYISLVLTCCALFTTVIHAASPRGLVAYYPLNATAADAGHNHYDGTVFGPVPAEDREGNADGSFNFSAPTDWIKLPIGPDVFTTNFTISVWLRMDDFESDPLDQVLYVLAGDQGCVRVQIVGDQASDPFFARKLSFYMFQPDPWTQVPGNEEGGVLWSTQPLEPHKWYFVCIVRNGDSFQMYIDGNLSAEVSSNRPITLTGSYLVLGNNFLEQQMYGHNSVPLHGSLDDVRIYNRALRVGEVHALFVSP
jgi:hypothetical protein